MDNCVTLAGLLTHEPLLAKVGEGEGAVSCRFTLGIHRRWKDRRTGENKTYNTYHEVVAFRDLARNAALSLHQGDSVVVVGRLNNHRRGDGTTGGTEIVADHIALDLNDGPIPVE